MSACDDVPKVMFGSTQCGRSLRCKVRSLCPVTIAWLLCFGILFLPLPALAADDAYLKQLEAEVSSGGGDVDVSNKKGGVKLRSIVKEINAEIVDQPGFEAVLRVDHPSTHALFMKLDELKRTQVFNEFMVTRSFKAASKKVLNLLYGI